VTHTLSGEVRVAVTEGLGTFWLAPRLVEFQQSFPNILVDLHCAMRSADVSRHEADVAIHLSRPTAPDVKLVRLGRMHLMFFASQKYIDTYGTPRTREFFSRPFPERVAGDENKCQQRQLLGRRQWRRHRRVSDICL
jgi:DNA-binding transcriptional LysR family regulator